MTVTGKPPGVYIEPITPPGPIVGVGTSTAALIGMKPSAAVPEGGGKGGGSTGDGKGDKGGRVSGGAEPIEAVHITNWTEYYNLFLAGKVWNDLSYAVRGFFENGGTSAYVVPVTTIDATGVQRGLAAAGQLPDVGLVCVPGLTTSTVQQKVTAHCKEMGDRFAILDGVDGDRAAAVEQATALTDDSGAYGALYWPWLEIDRPVQPRTATPATAGSPSPAATSPASARGELVKVPPSGHIAGIFARSDASVGVHKAPANYTVRGIRGLAQLVSNNEQGGLNDKNVNVIRRFAGRPPVVWGARTLSTDTAWRYVNVRRLVSYVEESLTEGLRWAVFAPNNTALWKVLDRTITEFLTRVWQAGALFGRSAKEAFYVQINEENNPPGLRKEGEVVVEIGLAPVYPAEFIRIRLGLWDGGSRISED